jgi:hypothetical protein
MIQADATLPGQRMQDVDRVAHVQALAEPSRGGGVRVQIQPILLVACSQHLARIIGDRGRPRHFRQQSAIRTAEPQLTIRLSRDLEALFMDRAVVPIADECEVGQRRGPTLGPVPDVMPLPEAHTAAREATAAVAMLQRAA